MNSNVLQVGLISPTFQGEQVNLTARTRCISRFANYLAPRTMSLSAFAAVKRSRVRAEILITSPVAGLRPIRALLLRLRKIPSPANRSEPSFFSSLGQRNSRRTKAPRRASCE